MTANDQDLSQNASQIAEIVDDYLNRARLGEPPSPDEYAERFPELASVIRDVLPAIAALQPYEAGNSIPPDQATSSDLPGYRLGRELGRGGMGIVFEATQESLQRRVAIKFLGAMTTSSPEEKKRFRREARICGQLKHPNIVTAYDTGFCGERPYLVMEFVDGQDLGQLLAASGPLSISHALDLITQAARGLAAAHHAGVVHRDVKPRNLMVTAEGTLKILDLGLARQIGALTTASDQALTTTASLIGTMDYLAPEQARNPRNADARSDLYGLGCTLYELLTGSKVYPAEVAAKKIVAHATAPIPWIRTLRPEVPESVEKIFQRLVAKDPADRFPSARALLVALEGLKINAAGRSTKKTRNAPVDSAWDKLALIRPRRPISRLLAAGLGILCVLALLAVGIYLCGFRP